MTNFFLLIGFCLIVIIFLVVLIVFIKKPTEQKLAEFATKIEVSSQIMNELKNSISQSLLILQNHINQTINQVSNTDSTLRTQLELLRKSINEQISSTIENLNLQVKTTTESTTSGFKLVSQQIDERLKNTSEIFSQITQMISKLDGSAEELKSNTQELLKSLGSVKLRGTFGEELLEKLLVDVLPEEYVKFQYPVNPHSNEKVDAVVVYKDKIIPIDSKFNIEKFLQYEQSANDKEKKKYEKELLDSIQQQIDSISEKYVLPQYGSEYAFMYIPSEAVFLKIMNLKIKDDSIIKYAAKKRVIISSPQTLLPYLQFIVTGLKTEQISKNVSILIKQLHALLNSLEKFKENFSVVGKHIKNAYERYIDTEKELAMLDTQLKGVASIDVKTNLQELPEKQKNEF